MKQRPPQALEEQLETLVRSAGLIFGVFVTGVIGYTVIGGEQYGVVDAIYMTMITLTTVGYAEVIDLSASPSGRLFTSALLFVGVGSFVYFFSNLTAFMVEGNLDWMLWRRKMKSMIDGLNGHFIVCGGGDTGQHVIAELLATKRPFVLVETDEDRATHLQQTLRGKFAVVIGDATDDDTLREAGIARASGLAACASTDKDNLIITVSARLMREDMRIVARCIDERTNKKMVQAGANAIVSPNKIGGLRLVSEMVRPAVVTFLDTMLRDKDKNLRIEELPIPSVSPFAGSQLGEMRERAGALHEVCVVALRRSEDDWVFNPRDDIALEPGSKLVFIGTPEQRTALERAMERA